MWAQEGWLYLEIILDLLSRCVVGWSLDKRMTQSLVIRALMMAVNLRQPPEGLVHHSDRGALYASHAYQALLKQYGMVCSMRRDRCHLTHRRPAVNQDGPYADEIHSGYVHPAPD